MCYIQWNIYRERDIISVTYSHEKERERERWGKNLGEDYTRIFVFILATFCISEMMLELKNKKLKGTHITSYMVESKTWRKNKSVTLELREEGNRL